MSAEPAPDRWREIKDALADALERDETGREILLNEIGASDPDLAREVRSLLGWHDEADPLWTPPLSRPHARLGEGDQVGPYVIQRMLDSGGMGAVYQARDSRLGRDVAIKVLAAVGDDGSNTLLRFQREARTVASLSHPNILSIFDYGRHGDLAYAVTELLVGENLRSRLRAGPIAVEPGLRLARQLAIGLAAAHEQGIVHRDLKPENIFICADGVAKILDFGLAKRSWPLPATGNRATLETQAGLILGTVGYMAPEQVRGQGVDARADVFAFGVMLHEMLIGTRPFDRATPAETLAAVLRDDLPLYDPAAFSWELSDLLRRCLAKDPSERPSSAADVVGRIEAAQAASLKSAAVTWTRRAALATLVAGASLAVRSGRRSAGPKMRDADLTIPVGLNPYSIAMGAGYIWTANYGSNTISRIRARDGEDVGTFPAGEMPSNIVWDGESIWVANHKWLGEYSTLMKIDPTDGRIVATYRIPGQPAHLMAAPPYLWVAETWPTYLLRKLRISDGSEVAAYTAGGIPRQTVSDGENVWVTNGAIGSVTRIRASDGKLLGALSIEGAPSFLRKTGNFIWVSSNRTEPTTEALLKIQADTLTLITTYATPNLRTGDVSNDRFFTAGAGVFTPRRTADGSITGRWRVGKDPVSMAFDGTSVWIADYTDHTVKLVSGSSLAEAERTT